MGLAAKIDTLGYALKATGLDSEHGSIVKGLHRARERRNLLAHVAIGPGPSGSAWGVYAIEFKGRGPRRTEVTVEGLKSYVAEVNALAHPLVELLRVIAARPSGDDGVPPFEQATPDEALE